MKKKDQHFVPKLYLKRFSIDKKETHLGLFNVSSEKLVEEAALRHQAYQKYFYGKDGKIENALEKVENRAIGSLKRIDNDLTSLKFNSDDHANILIYTVCQLARTRAKAKQTEDVYNKLSQFMDKGTDEIRRAAAQIPPENPAVFSLQTIMQNIEVAFDLDFVLLINKSSVPFITSDNPVAGYNQFLELRKHYGSITGLRVKGIQYFLPLDPLKCLLFYDNWTYKIGSRKNRIIHISSDGDINSLNLLQILNCEDNVYLMSKPNQTISDRL